MRKYVIYDDDGTITAYGQCTDRCWLSKIKMQKTHILEGVGKDTTHKVVDGKIVELAR